jgi:hypothetical protein
MTCTSAPVLKAKLGQEAVNLAHGVKYKAQTRLGEFLAGTEKHPGGGDHRLALQPVLPAPLTLRELDISKNESADAQFLFTLEEELPEEHRKIVDNEKTITQVRRELKKKEMLARVGATPSGTFRSGPIPAPFPYPHPSPTPLPTSPLRKLKQSAHVSRRHAHRGDGDHVVSPRSPRQSTWASSYIATAPGALASRGQPPTTIIIADDEPTALDADTELFE